MMNMLTLDWNWFDATCDELVRKIKESNIAFENVYGVPRGGLVVAVRLSHLLDLPVISTRFQIGPRTLVLDDICDEGGTMRNLYRFLPPLEPPKCATLVWTKWSSFQPTFSVTEKEDPASWLEFPWESSAVKDTVSKVVPK